MLGNQPIPLVSEPFQEPSTPAIARLAEGYPIRLKYEYLGLMAGGTLYLIRAKFHTYRSYQTKFHTLIRAWEFTPLLTRLA